MIFDFTELAFADHVHDLDACDQDAGTAKGLEPKHGSGDGFDGAVVLLGEVFEVLGLARLNEQAPVGMDTYARRGVCTALVNADLLGHAMQTDGWLEERASCCVVPPGSQQEAGGTATAVDRPLQVLQLARDLHIGLGHAPAMPTGSLRRQPWNQFYRPAM